MPETSLRQKVATRLKIQVEFAPPYLPDPQDAQQRRKIGEAVWNAITRCIEDPLQGRLRQVLDKDGDLQLEFHHIPHHFLLIIGQRLFIAMRKDFEHDSKAGATFVKLVSDVFKQISELSSPTPPVKDYEHSLEWSLNVTDAEGKGANKGLLNELLGSPRFFDGGLEVLRGDLTVSFVLKNETTNDARNYWISIEAPYNENHCRTIIRFSVRPYPETLRQTPKLIQDQLQLLCEEARNIQKALDLIDRHLCPMIDGAAENAKLTLTVAQD